MDTSTDTSIAKTSRDRDGIFSTLHNVYYESRSLLRRNDVTLEDARVLAQQVTDVRRLLADLACVETRLQRADHTLASIAELKERYSELEGLVKEVRNTMADKRYVVRAGGVSSPVSG